MVASGNLKENLGVPLQEATSLRTKIGEPAGDPELHENKSDRVVSSTSISRTLVGGKSL